MRTIRFFMLTAILAALCAAWGFVRAEPALEPARLGPGALVTVDLDRGAQAYEFVTDSGSVYDICAFPVDGGAVSARLWQGETLVAEGRGSLTLITERLTANAAYMLELSGEGAARLEVTRHALSRCFDVPMALDEGGDRYSKAIARRGDAHWYAVTAADDRPVMLAGIPAGGGLRLEARLFGEDGALLAEATPTTGGACLMDFAPEAGRTYRIRVSSAGGATGAYELRLVRSAGGLPEAVALSETSIVLEGRSTRRLAARIMPEDAAQAIYWESSAPSVARVDRDGTVSGRQPGTAVVTAWAAGAVRARCRVEVTWVPVEGIELITERIDVNQGDDVAIEWQLIPDNASNPQVTFEVSPAGVVEVDRAGVLRGVGVGEATVTLRTANGGFEAALSVVVAPPIRRYRALLVGEQNYAATAADERLGSANSVAGMRSMLAELSFGGSRFETTTRLDASRDGVLKAIDEAFGGALDQDVSLFYITCHGDYADGMTRFLMYDGSVLTASELRLALGRVPGEIVLLADCCGSGGVIGGAGGASDILKGIREVFGGARGASLFGASRFRVLASAAVEQDSYRISFSADAAESDMATVFARAVCDAGGWSIDRAARSAMRADVNYDNAVTLDELYRYVSRRVMWYLQLSGGRDYVQTVQVSPEGDVNALFERS